jgi:peptidyl-prolyl cis-trans isomerase A (cyclophilin A)
MKNRYGFLILCAAFLLALAGGNCSAMAQEKVPAKSPAKPAARPAAKRPFPAVLLTPAKLTEKAPETFDVKLKTTKGDFVIRVTRAWSPHGADRFYNLVKHRFYDGASFFRTIPGFVTQFGLSAYPEVTAAWSKAAIPDDPVVKSNKRGFVTYAMGGPNTRTTQVFINYGDNARLDSMGFSPFGEVIEGMEVVDQLFGGYGDSVSRGGKGPEQDLIHKAGRAYLERDFPLLDSIKSARIVSPAPPAAAPAPPKKAPPK